MGVSVLTAMIVQSRDVRVSSAGPDANSKYTGWVTLGGESRCRPLLSSPPTYDSHEDAVRAMSELVGLIRSAEKKCQ